MEKSIPSNFLITLPVIFLARIKSCLNFISLPPFAWAEVLLDYVSLISSFFFFCFLCSEPSNRPQANLQLSDHETLPWTPFHFTYSNYLDITRKCENKYSLKIIWCVIKKLLKIRHLFILIHNELQGKWFILGFYKARLVSWTLTSFSAAFSFLYIHWSRQNLRNNEARYILSVYFFK